MAKKTSKVGELGELPEAGRHQNKHKAEFISSRRDFQAHYPPSLQPYEQAGFYTLTESFHGAEGDLTPAPLTTYPDGHNLLAQTLGKCWPQPACRRYWSLGYKAEPILQIFHQLPTELRDAIGETLVAIQRFAEASCRHATCAARESLLSPAVWPGAATTEAGCGRWEHDTVHAFIRVDFEPATQERIAVSANARAAELLGMRHEELLASYAQHAVPLALPPLDALCGFLHSLRAAYDEAATRYARILVPGGAALVRVSTVKAFDNFRQLCQVPLCSVPPIPRNPPLCDD